MVEGLTTPIITSYEATLEIISHLGILSEFYKKKEKNKDAIVISGLIGVKEPKIQSIVLIKGKDLPKSSLENWIKRTEKRDRENVNESDTASLDSPYASSYNYWCLTIHEGEIHLYASSEEVLNKMVPHINPSAIHNFIISTLLGLRKQRVTYQQAMKKYLTKFLPSVLINETYEFTPSVSYKSVQRLFNELLFSNKDIPFAFQKRVILFDPDDRLSGSFWLPEIPYDYDYIWRI